MPSKQINDFLQKGNRKKIEFVARPAVRGPSSHKLEVRVGGQIGEVDHHGRSQVDKVDNSEGDRDVSFHCCVGPGQADKCGGR